MSTGLSTVYNKICVFVDYLWMIIFYIVGKSSSIDNTVHKVCIYVYPVNVNAGITGAITVSLS
ncbi:hypothetical protein A7311_19605 [Paenibacillus polymyxa]|uniref:hypothetical protein n=1 Tax=Paenibacillus polymyxa TaxID=1406 RepID=UPI000497A7B7|nr:hypothetical protein [Paenibacillus polymyxa]ODB55455.1 hypothetical protein A7311_19605 [Paenibacillus polymyxa]